VKTGTIVVADDEQRQRETLMSVLRSNGHTVLAARGGREAVAAVREHPVDIVLTDLRMPDLDGLGVVREVKALQPEVAVVVMTAFGSIAGAVEAMKAGAADFLTKPVDLDALDVVVARVLERRDLMRENRSLRRRLESSTAGFRLLGRSAALQDVLARAARAAETDATVLVRGESGTGKELLARSIHALSRRAEAPFVALNCAALPETLLESELFGHEKGAFTGAVARHRGRVEQAEGGTLFLDEIGDLPATVQVKLLRFVQERDYERLGGSGTLHADVRVMTATHRPLEEMVAAGTFREDLFYRLHVLDLTLPPLRERREDIPELAEHFLARFARRYDRAVLKPTREALDALLKYDYPGNVRELENILERAAVLGAGDTLTLAELPAVVRGAPAPAAGGALTPDAVRGDLTGVLEELERRLVLETLARHDGNQSSAARHLGLTESGLRYKLRKWTEGA
jgi:DNA-binding NtrC family response regulator